MLEPQKRYRHRSLRWNVCLSCDRVAGPPEKERDVPVEFRLMNSVARMTPKKIVVHTLIDEIRHWAQIATVVRLNGYKGEFHDFLFSPGLGGEIRREEARA
jgi:uncharacterized damage-inducible protein DinB